MNYLKVVQVFVCTSSGSIRCRRQQFLGVQKGEKRLLGRLIADSGRASHLAFSGDFQPAQCLSLAISSASIQGARLRSMLPIGRVVIRRACDERSA